MVPGWGEYLGYIDVTYSPTGKILAYHGAPIHLTNATAQDPKLQAQIKEWRGPFEAFAAEEVGTSSVELENGCRARECLMGQVMADAMLGYRLNQVSFLPLLLYLAQTLCYRPDLDDWMA